MQPETPKTAMPVVAGILTLVSGGLKFLGVLGIIIAGFFVSFAPRMPRFQHPLVLFSIIGILLLISGVIAVIGGVYTLRRKNWGCPSLGQSSPFCLLIC